MNKRNICTGMLVGAIVGGLVSLFNQDTRHYAKNKLNETKDSSKYYLKNPSESIQKTREQLKKWNNILNENVEGATNALEQVEDTIRKISK